MTVTVIINQQHSLFPQQESLLLAKFGEFERLNIPSEGMNLSQLSDLANGLEGDIVVASPIPALMKFLALLGKEFFVLHNDQRQKKELPNGKVIMTVAQEGWVIV